RGRHREAPGRAVRRDLRPPQRAAGRRPALGGRAHRAGLAGPAGRRPRDRLTRRTGRRRSGPGAGRPGRRPDRPGRAAPGPAPDRWGGGRMSVDLGDLAGLATALGLVDDGDLVPDWFARPGDYLSSMLREPGQREALVAFVDEMLGGDEAGADDQGR